MKPILQTPCRLAAVASLFVCLTAGAAASAVLPKPTGYYTRAAIAYADPSEGGVDAGWGFSAQLGAAYDAGEFGLEVGQLRFEQSESIDLGDGYVIRGSADLRASTALVGGRYGVRFGGAKAVTVRFGISGGVANLRMSVQATDGEFEAGLTMSETAIVGAGDVSAAWMLTDKLELSGSLRYMVAGSTRWEFEGEELEMGQLRATVLSVGLAYRW